MDFYLWSEVKRRVYVSEPSSENELRQRIRDAIDQVKEQGNVLTSLKNHLRKRARVCIEQEGGHFEQLLKYL